MNHFHFYDKKLKDTTLPSADSLRSKLIYYKITFKEKIKTLDNKIKQIKTQFDWNRKTAKSLAVSSRNVRKYESLTDEEALPETKDYQKKLLQSNTAIFSDMKKQTTIAKDQFFQRSN